MINKLGTFFAPTRLSEDSHIIVRTTQILNKSPLGRKPNLLNSILPWASSDRKLPRYSSESKAWIWLSRCKDVLATSHPKLGGWLENEGSGGSCIIFYGMVGWVVEDGCRCSNENFDVLFVVDNHHGIMIWNVSVDVFICLSALQSFIL